MSWLSSYSDANKIIDQVSSRIDVFTGTATKTYHAGQDDPDNPGTLLTQDKTKTIPITQQRATTETRFRWVNMDYNTALACAQAEDGYTPADAGPPAVPASTSTCVVRRQNDAGAYYVECIRISSGEWATV